MRQLVVIQNEKGEGLELLESSFKAAGFEIVHRFRQVNPEDADAPAVVVLGGPMGVYEQDGHPYLSAELRLLEERLSRRRPSIGICLGAQLLASAAGARVYPGSAGFELGAMPIQLTREGQVHPLFEGLPASLVAAHWHGDTFDAPKGSTHLARSAKYEQQAFQLENSYGFQFHMELSARTLGDWISRSPQDVRRSNKSAEELSAEVNAFRQEEASWKEVMGRLVQRVADDCNHRVAGA